jgi:3-phenylpropionate/trans-cinnamate dioxygenase ferredoxin reductase subunit
MTSYPPRPDDPTAGLVVVGGGPAGHSAAASYRKHGGEGRVVIISADGDAPYQRPPLSKDFLRGESEESALPMESPDFYRENQIELWLADSAIRLDLRSMAITTAANRDVTFDSCVLATGNEPATLPVPGGDHPEVLRLRFLRQARILRRAAGQARSAVIVGSGLIGCEVAASLAARGLHVAVLSMEELPQIGRLGRAAAERIAGRSRPGEHLFEMLPRTAIVD